MDRDALINEICYRVKERLNAVESPEDHSAKPKLLILTEDHGTTCHEALECPALKEYYQIECAQLLDYQCDIDTCEAVVADAMSIEAMGKIAGGIVDSGYTRLFGKALLSGKKIFLPDDAIELYQYREKAPAAYYQRLLANLKLLQDSGVVIAPKEELQSLILTGAPTPGKTVLSAISKELAARPELIIEKHIITEKDVTAVHAQKAAAMVVNEKAILTDLAREYAHKQNIAIKRRALSSERGNG